MWHFLKLPVGKRNNAKNLPSITIFGINTYNNSNFWKKFKNVLSKAFLNFFKTLTFSQIEKVKLLIEILITSF